MKTVRYTGLSTIREISEHEMKTAFGVTKKDGLLVDTRESRIVTVSNRLAEALVSTGEFVLFGAAPDDEDAETYGADVIPEVPDATTDSDEDVARAQHAPAPQEPVSDGTAKTTKKPKA